MSGIGYTPPASQASVDAAALGSVLPVILPVTTPVWLNILVRAPV